MPKLTRNSKEISVLVDGQERRFLLQANSITEQLNQLEIQEKGRLLGLELSESSISEGLTAACRAYLSSLEPLVVHLLSNPTDGGSALTAEEFWLLDSADPEKVIGEQEDLTAMERILGKATALQAVAGRRLLEKLSQAGSQ